MANTLGLKPRPFVFTPELNMALASTGIADLLKTLILTSHEAGFDEACILIHETYLSKAAKA